MGEWNEPCSHEGMSTPLRYRSLVAWQRADDLFVRLHQVSRQAFPPDERFCLAAQLRRAALSVPANIVEGTARHHVAETVQFLRTAWSSLTEVGYYLHVAHRSGYIREEQYVELEQGVRSTAAPLIGLIRQQLRKQASSAARQAKG